MGAAYWLGIPISVAYAISVVAIAVGNRFLNDYITSKAPNRTPNVYIMQLPTILYVVATLILEQLYKFYSAWLVKRENHRDEQAYESSLASKRFIFDFVNNYVSLYFLAFWNRSLAQLAQNIITFIVAKQFIYKGIAWF